eukprot:scaffold126022_cov17-Tisochrysis_lutea.AAC.3
METEHVSADAGFSWSWLERLENTLRDRVVMPVFNSNQRFVWQGAARVVTATDSQHQEQEQEQAHSTHNHQQHHQLQQQQQQQQQQGSSHSGRAHVDGGGAASATEVRLLTLDDAVVVDKGKQDSSYRQLFKRWACVYVPVHGA